MNPKQHELLQFFSYEHLPARLQVVSEPFCRLARELLEEGRRATFASAAPHHITLTMMWWERQPYSNVEQTWAGQKLSQAREVAALPLAQPKVSTVLRLVLEAKDCAVRAVLYKAPEGSQS